MSKTQTSSIKLDFGTKDGKRMYGFIAFTFLFVISTCGVSVSTMINVMQIRDDLDSRSWDWTTAHPHSAVLGAAHSAGSMTVEIALRAAREMNCRGIHRHASYEADLRSKYQHHDVDGDGTLSSEEMTAFTTNTSAAERIIGDYCFSALNARLPPGHRRPAAGRRLQAPGVLPFNEGVHSTMAGVGFGEEAGAADFADGGRMLHRVSY